MTRAQYLDAREQILLAYERGHISLREASQQIRNLDLGHRPPQAGSTPRAA
ncbi:hypothetical protein [Deinococcus pimensis]|uniref:hypothetical protein n=1 Tax=Deinococcus pimensis TaxID=309888 RepID=UPI0004B3804A|nr:hypothetical protein [Deinococcus pimensis]